MTRLVRWLRGTPPGWAPPDGERPDPGPSPAERRADAAIRSADRMNRRAEAVRRRATGNPLADAFADRWGRRGGGQ